MKSYSRRFDWLRTAFAVVAVGIVLNYAWEMAQAFLFVGMVSIQTIWWHCFVASLGDGIILLVIHLAGWTVFRQVDWFANFALPRVAFMLGMGLSIAVAVEWVAVHWLQRWAYTALMPMIAGLEIGVTPVLQMLMLPPLIFWVVRRWCGLKRVTAGA